MKCHDFEACMTDLLNGSLEDPEHREALEHALACPACEALLYEQQRLDMELKALAAGEWSGEAPPALEQRLTSAFREQTKGLESASPGLGAALRGIFTGDLKWKFATAAASLALCILLFWNLWKPSPQVPVTDVTVNPAVEQPVQPSFIERPPELATPELASAEAPRLPVMRRMRPRAPISPEPPRVEWITAEIATDFYTIPYVEAFGPNERVRVVRIQVPSSMLADFGLPVYSDLALRPVLADVMVGDDNVARSIRFIQQWRLPREQSHPVIKQAVN